MRSIWSPSAPVYLDVLGYAVEPRHINEVPRYPQVVVRNDVDRAHFGTLIGRHRVLAEKLHAHVADDDGEARCQNANEWIDVEGDDDPREDAGDAHETYENDRLRPVMNVKTFFPVQSKKAKQWLRNGLVSKILSVLLAGSSNLVWGWTDSALQICRFFFFVALNQPPSETLVMDRADVAGTPAGLDERLFFVLVVAHPTNQQCLVLIGSFGGRSDGLDLACEKFSWVEDPQLLGRERVPQTRQEPNGHADLRHAEANVVVVPRVHRHLLLPEISKRLARKESDNHNQHHRLTQQPDSRLVDLRCINVDIIAATRRRNVEIVDEPTADLEEDLNTVDQEEYDDDEQENGIPAVENAVKGVLVAEELCGQNLKWDDEWVEWHNENEIWWVQWQITQH